MQPHVIHIFCCGQSIKGLENVAVEQVNTKLAGPDNASKKLLTKFFPEIMQQETVDSSGHEGPKLQKTVIAEEIMESNQTNASLDPFVTLQNESPQVRLSSFLI